MSEVVRGTTGGAEQVDVQRQPTHSSQAENGTAESKDAQEKTNGSAAEEANGKEAEQSEDLESDSDDDSDSDDSMDPRQLQWIFNRSDWDLTPSVLRGGYTQHEERIERAKGIQTLLRVVEYMRLPLNVSAAATVFFHRFYMRRSLPPKVDAHEAGLRGFLADEVAATCVFLACKTEEHPRKLVHIIEAVLSALDMTPEGQKLFERREYARRYGEARYRRDTGQIYDYRIRIDEDPNARRSQSGRPRELPGVHWRHAILSTEMQLAQTLCFDFIVEYPFSNLIIAAKLLELHHNIFLACFHFLLDTMRDPAFVTYEPPVLAAGVYLHVSRQLQFDPSNFDHYMDPPPGYTRRKRVTWLKAFRVDLVEAEEAADAVVDMYRVLSGLVVPIPANLREQIIKDQEERQKRMESRSSGQATPLHSSRASNARTPGYITGASPGFSLRTPGAPSAPMSGVPMPLGTPASQSVGAPPLPPGEVPPPPPSQLPVALGRPAGAAQPLPTTTSTNAARDEAEAGPSNTQSVGRLSVTSGSASGPFRRAVSDDGSEEDGQIPEKSATATTEPVEPQAPSEGQRSRRGSPASLRRRASSNLSRHSRTEDSQQQSTSGRMSPPREVDVDMATANDSQEIEVEESEVGDSSYLGDQPRSVHLAIPGPGVNKRGYMQVPFDAPEFHPVRGKRPRSDAKRKYAYPPPEAIYQDKIIQYVKADQSTLQGSSDGPSQEIGRERERKRRRRENAEEEDEPWGRSKGPRHDDADPKGKGKEKTSVWDLGDGASGAQESDTSKEVPQWTDNSNVPQWTDNSTVPQWTDESRKTSADDTYSLSEPSDRRSKDQGADQGEHSSHRTRTSAQTIMARRGTCLYLPEVPLTLTAAQDAALRRDLAALLRPFAPVRAIKLVQGKADRAIDVWDLQFGFADLPDPAEVSALLSKVATNPPQFHGLTLKISQSRSAMRSAASIHIGNIKHVPASLPVSFYEDELYDLLKRYGPVRNVKLKCEGRRRGRIASFGAAYIMFESPDAAEKVLSQANGIHFANASLKMILTDQDLKIRMESPTRRVFLDHLRFRGAPLFDFKNLSVARDQSVPFSRELCRRLTEPFGGTRHVNVAYNDQAATLVMNTWRDVEEFLEVFKNLPSQSGLTVTGSSVMLEAEDLLPEDWHDNIPVMPDTRPSKASRWKSLAGTGESEIRAQASLDHGYGKHDSAVKGREAELPSNRSPKLPLSEKSDRKDVPEHEDEGRASGIGKDGAKTPKSSKTSHEPTQTAAGEGPTSVSSIEAFKADDSTTSAENDAVGRNIRGASTGKTGDKTSKPLSRPSLARPRATSSSPPSS